MRITQSLHKYPENSIRHLVSTRTKKTVEDKNHQPFGSSKERFYPFSPYLIGDCCTIFSGD